MSPETVFRVFEIVTFIGVVGFGALVLVVAHGVITESMRRRQWRRRARERRCVHCGHSLEGATLDQCSECGRDGGLASPANREVAFWSMLRNFWPGA